MSVSGNVRNLFSSDDEAFSASKSMAMGRTETIKDRPRRKTLVRAENFEHTTRFGQILSSDAYETFGGVVVLLNFAVMTVETHARAVGDSELIKAIINVNRLFLVFYFCESLSRLYVMRLMFFKSLWNNLDIFIVTEGILGEVLALLTGGGALGNEVGMLKSLRMIRLVRLLRLLLAFKELYVLIAGMTRCMKTLFWATLLIFMALNVWAILSVEFLREVTTALDDDGEYNTCSWCGTAFSNIWLANLTWFQIVSGDGWSDLGRGIVETHPWTFFFFVSNIVIVTWGLLNLIVAAIVESSVQAREDDISSAAKMAASAEHHAFDRFQALCNSMDTDGDGELSVEEFKAFFASSPELRNQLTLMGVQEDSLEGLIRLMDDDQSGSLDHQEFVKQFTRMRTLVIRTEIFYLVKYVENIKNTLSRQGSMLEELAEAAGIARVSHKSLKVNHNSGSSTHHAVMSRPYASLQGFYSIASSNENEAWHTPPTSSLSRLCSPDDGVVPNPQAAVPIRSTPPTTNHVSVSKGSSRSVHFSKAEKRRGEVTQRLGEVSHLWDHRPFTEELDKRFQVILEKLDQLPNEVTSEVLTRAGFSEKPQCSAIIPFAPLKKVSAGAPDEVVVPEVPDASRITFTIQPDTSPPDLPWKKISADGPDDVVVPEAPDVPRMTLTAEPDTSPPDFPGESN